MTRPLEDVQDEILDRLHAGEPIDREELLATHPEHRAALAAFFQVVDLVEEGSAPEEAPPARLGEFRIVREVGRGGMGVVYEAEQPSLKRRVALKVLPPALRADRARLARFKREAEAAARLRHPNVVPVFSFGEAAGTPFFAMELVDGTSLAEVVRERRAGGSAHWPERGEASWRRAVETVAKVAEALSYAHGRGILHRDVKPGNVLVERGGTPRLTDFGLALDLEAQSLTVSGEVFGSPRYMSPEQAFRREVPLDARTDVYSLAVTLYELLTLELPYRGTTQTDVLSALSSGEVVPLREVDASLPAALEAVLARGLAHEPEERYRDAASFAEDLRRVLEGRAVVPSLARARAAPKEPARERRGPVAAVRRMPVALQVAAGCGALLLTVFFVSGLVATTLAWRARAAQTEAVRARAAAEHGRPTAVPTAQVLLSIARGVVQGGERILLEWAQPSLRLRSVVARDRPAIAQLSVTFPLPPEGLAQPITAIPIWEYRVDEGPWEYAGIDAQPVELVGTGTHSFVYGHDVLQVLGDAATERSARLGYRLRLRVVTPPPPQWEGRRSVSYAEAERPHGDDPRPGIHGAGAVWVFEDRTLFFYDSFPEDYPRPVRDAALDRRMREAWTPEHVTNEGARGRELQVGLFFGASQFERPLPGAFEVELLTEDGVPIATGELAGEARGPGAEGTQTTTLSTVELRLGDEPTEAEQRFLLAWEAGTLDAVRLRMRASRDVALGEPDFERYWDGEIEARVAVRGRR